MRRMIGVLCFFTLCVLVAAAQQSPPNATTTQVTPAKAPGTIRVQTQLVVEEVAVKDKSGKPIEGLTANDFTLTEDGVPQTIGLFEFQRLQAAASSAELPPRPRPVVPTAPPPARARRRPLPRPPPPGSVLQHVHDAARRSAAGLRCRAQVHRHADGPFRSH